MSGQGNVGLFGQGGTGLPKADLNGGIGVWATVITTHGTGVVGQGGGSGVGVQGTGKYGVFAEGGEQGLHAQGSLYGIQGTASGSTGAGGQVTFGGYGVFGITADRASGYAGYFAGRVYVEGDLFVSGGTKQFLIDHPLDPARKYLSHAAVESSDMKNIYDGLALLDESGEAVVELPKWFEALNKDFCYQLAPIGAPARDLYIAEKIHNNRFKIAGGSPGLEVSWQVTGKRQDGWAQAHPFTPEQEKPINEQNYYLHPELFGQPSTRSIHHARHEKSRQRREDHQKEIEMRRRWMEERARQFEAHSERIESETRT
jgi:hypothetical protein